MKALILRLLNESDGFVSGQQLCDKLGVSRTAVWKMIHQLQEEGYDIESVKHKGYRLRKAPDILSEAEIMSQLHACEFGRQVIFFDEVSSTNTQAKILAEQGAAHGTLVVAETQNAGRGRRGRGWFAPPGQGIWMSLIMKPEILPAHASMLTLVAAMAAADGLMKFGVPCEIKWPNDIVIRGKKVCGILTEMSTELSCINYIVTGMGINVHNTEFPEEIAQVATSVDLALGAAFTVRRSELIAAVIAAFEHYYEIFVREQNLAFMKGDYNARLVNMNREICLIENGVHRSGISGGIDDEGCLIVLIDGKEEHIVSGEVSVRGVLGYV